MRISREAWLKRWIEGNNGLCPACNKAVPSASPLICPSDCDLEAAYQRGGYTTVGKQDDGNSHRIGGTESLPIVRSLGDLLSDPRLTDPPKFIIPGLVEVGAVTMLSGAPKAGKSTFVSQLAAAYSKGDAMLDGQVMGPGSVLWFALDEPLRRLAQRFLTLGADPDNFRVVERGRQTLTPDRFEAILQKERPMLVVIDTLSQFAADKGIKVNDAESVAPFFKQIVTAVQELGDCGAILLFHAPHHANRASGSVQWAAIADATLVLRRYMSRRTENPPTEEDSDEPDVDDGRRVLSGISRWAGDQKMNLAFSDGRYVMASSVPLLDRLRTLLHSEDGGVGRTSQAVLAKRLGVRPLSLAAAVDALVGRGEARRCGSGRSAYVEKTASLALYLNSSRVA